jgi:hypothetical protein
MKIPCTIQLGVRPGEAQVEFFDTYNRKQVLDVTTDTLEFDEATFTNAPVWGISGTVAMTAPTGTGFIIANVLGTLSPLRYVVQLSSNQQDNAHPCFELKPHQVVVENV